MAEREDPGKVIAVIEKNQVEGYRTMAKSNTQNMATDKKN